MKDHYQHIVDLCREQARQCLEGFLLPEDYTIMQLAAVHAYFLTYSDQYVKLWERQGPQNLWGPHAPEDMDHLKPK